MDPWVATSLRLHEIETGRLLFEMDFAGMTFIGLVPGSNTCVCAAADGTISLRDLRTGQEQRRVTLQPVSSAVPAAPSVKDRPSVNRPEPTPGQPQLTSDGKQLVKPVVGGGFVLYDLASGAELARFKPSETGRSPACRDPGGGTLWTRGRGLRRAGLLSLDAFQPGRPTVPDSGRGPKTRAAAGARARRDRDRRRCRRGGPLPPPDPRARAMLAVFDVNSSDIVKTVPLAAEKVLVAASASKFVIAYPDTKRIERWDFATLARDGDPQALPLDGTLEAIALGADSEGPLLASWWFPDANPALKGVKHNRLSFIDLTNFKVLAVGADRTSRDANDAAAAPRGLGGRFRFFHGGWTGQTRIRASYDGSLFGICRADDVRVAAELALKADAGAVSVSHDIGVPAQFGTPAYIIPSPDGRRVFHGKTGIRDAVFLETPMIARTKPHLDDDPLLRFPTTDPRFDFSLRAADTITVLRPEDGTKLLTVADLDEMTGVLQQNDIVRDGISLENRYHFVPAAKLLVTIPPTNDRLVLRRLEIDAAAMR